MPDKTSKQMLSAANVYNGFDNMSNSIHCDKVSLISVETSAIKLRSRCRLSSFSEVYFGYLMKAICRAKKRGLLSISNQTFAIVATSNAFVEQIESTTDIPLWNACMTDKSAEFHYRIPRPYKMMKRFHSSPNFSNQNRFAIFRATLSSYDMTVWSYSINRYTT
jgi:hypothetical protein